MKAQFKCRCSQIGNIMTEARSKSEPLSKTTITYLEEWAKELIYGVRKEIISKYVDKGIQMENEAIEFVSISFPDYPFMLKNEQSFENEFITGTPDIILDDCIIDIKCSWDCFTFPLFENDLPEKNYYWQMQGYMALTGKKKAKVIYCLMNTPEELDKYAHDYSKVPAKYRIKEYMVYRNDEDIKRIYARVKECQTYINEL